jgi:hypothetical protein
LRTSVFPPLNDLTRLIAREKFVVLIRRESSRSYSCCLSLYLLTYLLTRSMVQDIIRKADCHSEPWYLSRCSAGPRAERSRF